MTRRIDREGPIHRAILGYLRAQFPSAVIHHSPNEVSLRGKDVARAIAKAKGLGMAVGFPDLLMIHDGHTVAFEVKAEKGRATDAQSNIGELMIANGAMWAVVRSVDDVKARLKAWEVLA